MDKPTRNAIERATQQARKLLDEDFSSQLEGTLDVLRNGVIAPKGGAHLSARQQFQRDKIVATIEHKRAAGATAVEAVTDYVRDAAFTTLNRFVALKMLEARQLVQECITKGEQSGGYREFCGMAPGVALLPEATGYRLYVESLFDELSTEIKVLFDRRDAASILWPKRQTFEALLAILNAPDLSVVWGEDETIGWVYQFFNSGEERKKMRDESQAPRNSRELAVRNQFFTPRYVVQFLADNTLGRLWLEMNGKQTRLTSLCDYLVRSADEPSQPRPRKDPRDLRILDPACGSGHFLLYSFDLLLAIYEEAWSAEGTAPKSELTGCSLHEDYPNLADLRRATPRLIVEHNLHGVDIDPRCAQIAALALWLRAQRAWKDLGIVALERPRIQRTHIVVAEPVPGDASLVDDFAAQLAPPLLRGLFKKMVDESRLAGELGTLLRIEEGIATELHRAREQFVKQRQSSGFLPGLEPVARQGALDLSGIDDDGFFHEAEVRIVEALRAFAETASGSANVRRRLFAGDAAQGIALIDLVRTQFDVVLMNPPFGDCSPQSKNYLTDHFGGTWRDIYACFVARASNMVRSRNGMVGALLPRTGLFIGSMGEYRAEVLQGRLRLLADLGKDVLDGATVRTACFVLSTEPVARTLAIRVGNIPDRDKHLRNAVDAISHRINHADVFEVEHAVLRSLPGGAFAYWFPPQLIRSIAKSGKLSDELDIRQGIATGDNFRFLRCRWEASLGTGFRVYNKGGAPTPFLETFDLVVQWEDDGREMKARAAEHYGSASRTIKNEETFGKAGITYSQINDASLRFRIHPAGAIYDMKGPVAFPRKAALFWPMLGILNSSAVEDFMRMLTDGRQWHPTALKQVPLPRIDRLEEIEQLTKSAVELQSRILCTDERSPLFASPLLVPPLETRQKIRSILAMLDDFVWEAFGASKEDVAALAIQRQRFLERNENDVAEDSSQAPRSDVLSWGLGLAFSRWRRFSSDQEAQEAISPALREILKGWHPAIPTHAPAESSEPAILALVDDQGHAADVAARIENCLDGVHKQEEIRTWLRSVGFEEHLSRYKAAGRVAPIYWQLSTSSGRYSVWLYLPAFTKDSIHQILNDYVIPKLGYEERRLESLRHEIGENPKSAERRAIADQASFVEEIRRFLDDLKRVAPLWNPNLKDGVIINYALLWRLTGHHKPWQKELKATWDALCAGECDWSHLAMQLWPERVVLKCAADRSLAIAHKLEDVFWAEGDDGKWKPRPTPTRPVDELVRERTSIAVKAALKSLFEAPAPSANSGRRRGRHAASGALDREAV